MDRGYEKETFAGLRIKISVAMKFRSFSKRQGKSHSMTLLAMVEFFDHNGISPDERMNETIASLKYLIKRRFNAMVAIMRSIEKEQTLPTVSMIQALFQQELEPEEEDGWEGDFDFFEQQLTEKKTPSKPELLDTEISVPKIMHEHLKEELEELKRDFGYVLDHVYLVKNRLGKEYLKLDLDPEVIERYQQKIKNL
ncbi:PP2C family serine/threonine-protein phosphatase [Flagellimonas okinawensis]|uniref:PP2C family serine/threonine-protein phosphatase n=1 Tax=Flagellimonas okinawensis TaxID=3031324 RepID=A0ABT5XRS1_9FLAO|nr:PP2C family serine/threonine-protein phosphatase [[Muricauda] okinawensis]MDF0708604.1 PP2C family serine/threonine-protein phosphatase [[Muricauda] okinawensis]